MRLTNANETGAGEAGKRVAIKRPQLGEPLERVHRLEVWPRKRRRADGQPRSAEPAAHHDPGSLEPVRATTTAEQPVA